MKKTLLASVLAGAAVLAAAPAADAAEFAPWFGASRAGGFIDLWPSKGPADIDQFVMVFGADLQFRVAPKVFLDMSFSGAFVDIDSAFGRSNQAAYGNPTFGAHYADQINSKISFYVGGTFTPPVLHDPDGRVAGAALYAAPIRGYWDADRWIPGHFAVRGMGGIEWEIVKHFYFRADLRPVVYGKTNSSYGGDDVEFFLEQGVEGEYRLDNGLGFGLRIQGVGTFTEPDAFQAMAEPFLALTPRTRGLYLRLGFPLALDEPLGFGFDRGRLAAVKFAIGGQW